MAHSRTYAAVVLLALSACGEDPTIPREMLSEHMESAHFEYRFAPGDRPDTVFQERHYAWAVTKLVLQPARKVEFNKYRDRDHLKQLTGRVTNGFADAEGYRFHTIWSIDNHEYIHAIFVALVGTPPPLFNEGIAVAHHGASIHGEFEGAPLWNGVSVHRLAAEFRAQGVLPALDQLLDALSFSQRSDGITYPVSGSFVRFLVDERGIALFKQFAARLRFSASRDEIRREFQAVYGESIDSFWNGWLSFLPTSN